MLFTCLLAFNVNNKPVISWQFQVCLFAIKLFLFFFQMEPSKKWMNFFNDRFNEQYKVGVQRFLNYAFAKTGEEHEMRCSCVKCNNTDFRSR